MPHPNSSRILLVGVATAVFAAGCGPQSDAQFTPSEEVQKLDDKLQAEIGAFVEQHCGTLQQPQMLGQEDFDLKHLRRGRDVFMLRCWQCHGVTGDGNGPSAALLTPRPRDYRQGIFKFTSTPYGMRPRREDLVRTVYRGVPGTSMPPFKLLPKGELEAVVDYVISLSRRGEFEHLLAYEVEFEERIDPAVVPDYVSEIQTKWQTAHTKAVSPLTPQPEFTVQHVAAGRQAFLTKACSQCHGEDGRGQTPENFVRKDVWGQLNPAADLTSGFLHGGGEPLDIYRRIYSGINGTAMPSFQNALEQEPETIWNLVAFVQYVSNQRRNGVIPQAGPIRIPQAPVTVSDAGE